MFDFESRPLRGFAIACAVIDLALGAPAQTTRGPYLVTPDERAADVRAQVRRPALRDIAALDVRFLPYSELELHRAAMARFGEGLKAIQAVAQQSANRLTCYVRGWPCPPAASGLAT
jgi:hypothetical protein